MSRLCALVLLGPLFLSEQRLTYGQRLPPEPLTAVPKAADVSPTVYLSGMIGNGRITGASGPGNQTMRWRALEARAGIELGPGQVESPRHGLRVDMVYINEGHPDNHHRDGFAGQLVYSRRLSDSLVAEVGAGPYLSMNTTTITGTQINDSRWGALLSVAVRIGGKRASDDGVHYRIGLNHATARGAHSSNSLMVGIGKRFRDPPRHSGASPGPVWIAVAAGTAITNHSNVKNSIPVSLEAKRYSGRAAGSISLIHEGGDHTRVDRNGVALQAWYVQPLDAKWSMSAGIGPYIANNRRGTSGTRVHGLITLQAERVVGADMKLFASFSRVKTFKEKNDRDLFRFGLMKAFD